MYVYRSGCDDTIFPISPWRSQFSFTFHISFPLRYTESLLHVSCQMSEPAQQHVPCIISFIQYVKCAGALYKYEEPMLIPAFIIRLICFDGSN